MSEEFGEIRELFKQFIHAVFIECDCQKALLLIAEDVIGIGMGSQGIVYGKDDVIRIMGDNKSKRDDSSTEIEYINIQTRCYDGLFATVCGVLNVKTTSGDKTISSTLGQLINFRKENGCWLIYALQATPLFSELEELEAYPIRFAENILETYRQQEQLAKNAQVDSLAIYLINFTDGVFENSLLKSESLVKTSKGETYEDVMFDNAHNHLNEEDAYQFIRTFSLGNIQKVYQKGQTELALEYELILSTQEMVWMKTVIKLYTDENDQKLKGYLYVIDIDERKRRELELQNRSEIDSMTNLYNKVYTEIKICEQLKKITSTNRGVFYMIDLDYFKNINDTYGHQEGDRIIKAVADIILSMIRKDDIAGRIGGDEFCIYLQGNLSQDEISEKANLLCKRIKALIPKEENGISCSIGIVICQDRNENFTDIYRKADQALYHRKRLGRNGYTIYS